MRVNLFPALSIVGLAVIALPGPPAVARSRSSAPAVYSGIQDRYCLQSKQWGYPGNCAFSTYEQCLATASGTEAGCGINPQYLFPPARRDDPRPR